MLTRRFATGVGTRFIDPNLRFSVEGMFSQFIETIYEEMDYLKEAKNLLAIKKNLKNEENIVIPNLLPEMTSKHIITTEYVPGIKITDIKSLDKMGIDRQKLVILLHHIFFKMLLRNSIFHSDPHPGNIAVKDDGSIILYDFGMVGRLDNETRLLLIRLYLGLIDKDPIRTVDVLIQLGRPYEARSSDPSLRPEGARPVSILRIAYLDQDIPDNKEE